MKIFYLAQRRLTNKPPLVKADTRAFLHGESVFTSFMAKDGKVLGLKFHKERIIRGARTFWDTEADELWQNSLEQLQEHKVKLKTLLQGSWRVRLSCYWDEGLESLWSFEKVEPFLKEVSVQTLEWENTHGIFNFKSADYAKIFSELRKNKSDDFLKIGANKEVYELTTSNILVSLAGELLTPPISSNVLEGCQLSILKQLPSFSVKEQSLSLEDLHNAEFVLGSNAVKEFFVISQLDQKPLLYSEDKLNSFLDTYRKESIPLMVELC